MSENKTYTIQELEEMQAKLVRFITKNGKANPKYTEAGNKLSRVTQQIVRRTGTDAEHHKSFPGYTTRMSFHNGKPNFSKNIITEWASEDRQTREIQEALL